MATPQSVDPHCPECGSLLEYRLDTQDYIVRNVKLSLCQCGLKENWAGLQQMTKR